MLIILQFSKLQIRSYPMLLNFFFPPRISYLSENGNFLSEHIITCYPAINVIGDCYVAGNFLFSLRPEFSDGSVNDKNSLSAEWSDDLKGGKAVCVSGILDQLSYKVRKALSVGSMKYSFSTACCTLKSNGAHVSRMHFLIQSIGRDVPVIQPDKSSDHFKNRDSPVAIQEQKEIFLLPTIKVSNFLHTEIHVLLSETGKSRNFMG